MKKQGSAVGIHDMAAYIPKHYLPIEDLAVQRGIEPDKLTKGLGLQKMALPDVFEDTATMAAEAVLKLMEQNKLIPQQIGRLYLGTESALDGAKPTATYTLEMLRQTYKEAYGPDCFSRCDVIDMTFACIGATDALLNTVDWVRAGTGRIGIVVASDFAKYELNSTGEYTQGAGAVALLITESPSLLAVLPDVGVSTGAVHDFFKPVEAADKVDMVQEVLQHFKVDGDPQAFLSSKQGDAQSSWRGTDKALGIHRMTPTFDGAYSNDTYQRRVYEAYQHFVEQVNAPVDEQPLFTWSRIVMHLPYAAHGRRMLMELFVEELDRQEVWNDVASSLKLDPKPLAKDFDNRADYDQAWKGYLRAVGKSSAYKSFVEEQLKGTADASSEIGNLYAGSVFMALMSMLSVAHRDSDQLAGKRIGFIAYGSGSKSKVFTGGVRSAWEDKVKNWTLFSDLAARSPISYEQYEALHRGMLDKPLSPAENQFALKELSAVENKRGARYYRRMAAKKPVASPS